MNSLLSEYRQLLALSQLYLLREFPTASMKATHNSATAQSQATNIPKIEAMPSQPQLHKAMPTTVRQEAPLPSTDSNITKPNTLEAASKDGSRERPLPASSPSVTNKGLALESLPPRQKCDLSEYWKLYPQLFPDLQLRETIPNDDMALKVKNAWLEEHVIPPVVLLSFHSQEKNLTFLKNVAHAISLRFTPAKVIAGAKWEKENGWEKLLDASSLRLIIATDYDLYLQPALMKVYREESQQGRHYLKNTPLLLLSDISLYLKEPQLKSLLWRAICNEFATKK